LSLDLEPASFVWLDLFPAEVVDDPIGAKLGDELRVVVTDNHLYVLMDSPDGPVMWFKEPLADFSGDNKIGYRVETESNIYYVKRAPNCGCGASLRGIRLFTDLPYVRPS
jgi:hypothetical protein